MRHKKFKIVLFLLLLLPLNSCWDYTIEEIMLKFSIPQGISCSFLDKHGNDLVKELIDNNPEIIFDDHEWGYKIKSEYYSLRLEINGAFYPVEDFIIRTNSGVYTTHPTTGEKTGYTLDLRWETLFTEELLNSKWRDFHIEYYVIFPELFKDNKEHLFECKIVLIDSDPSMIDLTFDGKPIEHSLPFSYITL